MATPQFPPNISQILHKIFISNQVGEFVMFETRYMDICFVVFNFGDIECPNLTHIMVCSESFQSGNFQILSLQNLVNLTIFVKASFILQISVHSLPACAIEVL